jgi:hypothetical protein
MTTPQPQVNSLFAFIHPTLFFALRPHFLQGMVISRLSKCPNMSVPFVKPAAQHDPPR